MGPRARASSAAACALPSKSSGAQALQGRRECGSGGPRGPRGGGRRGPRAAACWLNLPLSTPPDLCCCCRPCRPCRARAAACPQRARKVSRARQVALRAGQVPGPSCCQVPSAVEAADQEFQPRGKEGIPVERACRRGEHVPRIRNALCLWRWHATLRKPSLGQAQRAQLQSATN